MSPALVPAAIVGGTALSYVAAAAVGVPALVPFFNVAAAFPFMAGRLFLRGEIYRREMFAYLTTGMGPEGDPRLFIPVHLTHAVVFCLLALATGGTLAMALGAVLMNYMAYYVGALGAASAHPWQAMALAWAPWAVVRVASFVTLGVVLGGSLLGRLLGFPFRPAAHARWLALAGAGLVLDILLKWKLAPAWREMILGAAGW
jgi:hypothetical protein